jgi:predicted RNA-binding protein associated with RNAse of E/G family
MQTAHPAYRIAQQINMVGQQGTFPFQKINGEKITTTYHKVASIVGHTGSVSA